MMVVYLVSKRKLKKRDFIYVGISKREAERKARAYGKRHGGDVYIRPVKRKRRRK